MTVRLRIFTAGQSMKRLWIATAVDITYASLAKAFNQSLKHHEETLRRMGEMRHRWPDIDKQNEEQRAARMRMALFPEKAEVLYTDSEIWVVCITC